MNEWYRPILHGEKFQKTDQINYNLGTSWKPIPDNWIGQTYDENSDCTLNRCKLGLRHVLYLSKQQKKIEKAIAYIGQAETTSNGHEMTVCMTSATAELLEVLQRIKKPE